MKFGANVPPLKVDPPKQHTPDAFRSLILQLVATGLTFPSLVGHGYVDAQADGGLGV